MSTNSSSLQTIDHEKCSAAIFIGQDEINGEYVTLKNLITRTQETCSMQNLVSRIVDMQTDTAPYD